MALLLGVTITVGTIGADASWREQWDGASPVNGSVKCVPSSNRPCSIEIPVDLQKVSELQRGFEEGHQPWRGDPISVAHVTIMRTLEREMRYEDLKVEHETRDEAVVAGRGSRYAYRVHLKRLIVPRSGKNGIWTAVRIDYRHLEHL